MFHRREMMRLGLSAAAGLAGTHWLTPVAQQLARAAESPQSDGPAQSVILLWLAGGPSQLETFDPHPRSRISGGTKAINTPLKGVQLAAGLQSVAERMDSVSLIRSMVSKEGDHRRGLYLAKTGYRPDPVTHHPSVGAICCHELPSEGTDIPRHVSILPDQQPAWGGYLGARYDAFKTFDPRDKLPDLTPTVDEDRFRRRIEDLKRLDSLFAQGRERRITATDHGETLNRAQAMMSSEQLSAFDVSQESESLRKAYGETPFGRGCLAARRLIQSGVRCVEVTLGGWDSHVNNHAVQTDLVSILDPERTLVLCGGEFGRTPDINALGGRDHWPKGFSLMLAGGKLARGRVLGGTDPDGEAVTQGTYTFADVHATLLTALGIDTHKEFTSKALRPIKISEGTVIREILRDA
jgi:hypothetical protein